MTYPRPLQPKAALLESEDTTNVIGKTVTHYLTDLDQTGLPYSRNHFMLVELMTTSGVIPQPNTDVVVFHHDGIVRAVMQVSGIVAIQSAQGFPGQYRTLVSCEPMVTLADVLVAEEHEYYLDDELDHLVCRISENRCPPTSKGHMPKGAPMRDQKQAADLVLTAIEDAILAF